MGGLALSGDLLRFTNFTRYLLAKFACLRWHTYCLRYCLALSGARLYLATQLKKRTAALWARSAMKGDDCGVFI